MPIDAIPAAAAPQTRALDSPRVRRIVRFTLGVTLATAFSSYVNWSFSFMLVALVIALMALPTPAPSLRFAAWTVIKLISFIGIGVVLMLPLHSYQLFGLALVALILFFTFYLQAQGKIASLNAIFVIVGVTLVPAFGQDSMDVGVEFAKGMSQSTLALFPIIWIAFAVLPGGTFPGLPNAPRVEGTSADRGILALRPVVVLLPLVVYMLGSDNAIRYLIGYYQPAMIAQHASRATARKLAGDLVMATVIGATAGLIMWWLMKLWPSWFWFVLMMGLFSFFFATRIFADGPKPLTPNYYRWSYGFYTDDLMIRIPKQEYLYGTSSSLGDKASFGLDFGEIYKRSVVGVRIYGVPAGEKNSAGRLLQAHQRRLSQPGQEDRVPRR